MEEVALYEPRRAGGLYMLRKGKEGDSPLETPERTVLLTR